MGGDMIYQPKSGAMWDPPVLYQDGAYYAFMMYNREGQNGLEAGHCLLATSVDGVHWEDAGIVNEEMDRDRGSRFFKCFVGRCGDRFILDHGVRRPGGQDTMRFYESTDLLNWNYLYSSQPDPRWYTQRRWDHMYILPKVEGDHSAGFWGHPVAQAREECPRGVGLMQSTDGQSWQVLPPAKVEWGDTPPVDLEWGGCERFGGRYYLIGGGVYMGNKGYSMYVFSADDPRGPFTPERGAYRLCGSSEHHMSWLAAWCRGDGELLISNYASLEPESRAPWMLPLRKPVLSGGHLCLGWWPQNEGLKDEALPLKTTSYLLDSSDSQDGYSIAWMDTDFDMSRGIVLEGFLTARFKSMNEACAAGIVLYEGGARSTAIQLGIGSREERETHIGSLQVADGGFQFTSNDVTAQDCATVNGVDEGTEHAFRLLIHRGAFELYIDDLLVQTHWCSPMGNKIGFLARNADATVTHVKAWSLSLSSH
jgi:hypothetical protein